VGGRAQQVSNSAGSLPATRFAVFDIDGVLADVRHRLHLVTTRPKRWEEFFRRAVDDPALPEGQSSVTEAVASGLTIVYSTGRPERWRRDTISWLARWDFPAADLHMRADHDRRPARMTKVAVARRLATTGTIDYLVDDDASVVAALTRAGFTVRHATWMPTEPSSSPQHETLFDLQEEGHV
jgi:phosphoglycolate phosphatase-like HAD superfamily hydrolase